MSIINKCAFVLAVAVASQLTYSQITKTYHTNWEYVKVVDGDTVKFRVKFLPKELGDTLSVRVNGVDTPEKGFRAQCEKEKQLGEQASEFTKSLFIGKPQVAVTIDSWDKYGGRVLGDVYVNGYSLSKMLIEKGYAREYHGEKKQSWCN